MLKYCVVFLSMRVNTHRHTESVLCLVGKINVARKTYSEMQARVISVLYLYAWL